MANCSFTGTTGDQYYILGYATANVTPGTMELSINDNILSAANIDFQILPNTSTDYFCVPMLDFEAYTLGGASPNFNQTILGTATGGGGATITIKETTLVAIKATAVDAVTPQPQVLSTSSTTAVDAADGTPTTGLPFTVAVAGDYFIIATCFVTKSNTTDNFTVQVDIDGTPYVIASMRSHDNTGVYYLPYGMVKKVTLAAGSHRVKFQGFNSSTGTLTLTGGAILVMRADKFPRYIYQEAAGSANNIALATLTDVNSLTATVPAKPFIVLGSALISRSTTARAIDHRLIQDGVAISSGVNTCKATSSQYCSFGMARSNPIAAGSHTWTQSGLLETSTVARGTLSDCALLIIEESDLINTRWFGGKLFKGKNF